MESARRARENAYKGDEEAFGGRADVDIDVNVDDYKTPQRGRASITNDHDRRKESESTWGINKVMDDHSSDN